MRFSSSTVTSVLLVGGIVALIGTAVGQHLSMGELVARSRACTQALQAQLMVARTGALLLDVETGQRGFIITGETVFLEPYERALRHERQRRDQAERALLAA